MRRYAIAASAQEDLSSIADYISDAAGGDLAAEVISRIQQKCELLA